MGLSSFCNSLCNQCRVQGANVHVRFRRIAPIASTSLLGEGCWVKNDSHERCQARRIMAD